MSYIISKPEEFPIYQQISDVASKFFLLESLMLLIIDNRSQDLVVMAGTGIRQVTSESLTSRRLPLQLLKPFLSDQFKISNSYLIGSENLEWKDLARKYLFIHQDNKAENEQNYKIFFIPINSKFGELLGFFSFYQIAEKASSYQEKIGAIESFAELTSLLLPVITERANGTNAFEEEVLEDDLHELKNYYYYGVHTPIDTANYWLQNNNVKKAQELLSFTEQHSSTFLNELYSLRDSLQKKYYQMDDIGEALTLLIKNIIPSVPHSHDINIDVNYPQKISLPHLARYSFIRIAAGAIQNAIVHSGILDNPSLNIVVEVEKDGDTVTMIIKDTGVGAEEIKAGYGIGRMMDMVRFLNHKGIDSKLTIDSELNRGTTVKLTANIKEIK